VNVFSSVGSDAETLDAVLNARSGDGPARLAFASDAETVTYADLRADTGALAGGLARLGVWSGDRVVLVLPAGLTFIRAFFALQRLGAAPCALDPQIPPRTTAARATRVRPRLVLTAGSGAEGIAAACGAAGLPVVDFATVPRTAPFFERRVRGNDVAFLQLTSGTSGEPRAAVITQRSVLASLRAAHELLAIEPKDILVSWVPPWHDLGLLRFVLGPVYFGTPCHLVPPAIRTLGQWLAKASEVRATILGAPDFAYRLAARLVDPRGLDLSSLRFATNGGEPVRQSTIFAFEERFRVPGVIRPGYGMAEATLGVTCLRPGEALRADSHGNVSCGRPFPGVEVRIAGSDSVETGRVGEILLRGPACFGGYFDAPEESRQILRGGWLHTSDIGVLDADRHLYVLSRERALLKRGGVPLAPRELEEPAELLRGVRVAAAVGLPSAGEGAREEIVLAVEVDRAHHDAPSQLAAAAAATVERTVGFPIETIVILAPRSIPRTANGKIRYQELRRKLAGGELDREGRILFTMRRS
jgi:acyl-CoA synthetase (AMP-forming)/AMP-acid ligase II